MCEQENVFSLEDELDLLSNKSGSKQEKPEDDQERKSILPKRGDAWDSL